MQQKLELIGSIYDAAINHALWPDVTARIAEYCGGEKVMLATTDVLHPHSNFQQTFNIPAEHIAEWREGMDEKEVELHNRWLASAAPNTAISSDVYFGGPEQFTAEGGAFVAMLNRFGIRRQMATCFARDYFRFSGVGLNNYDPFPIYAAERLQSLAPHLARALEIYRQITHLNRENQGLYQLLELMNAGVILLDVSGRVRYTTQHARQMIMAHGKVSIQQGRLFLHDNADQEKLSSYINNAIHIALREPSNNTSGVLNVAGNAEGHIMLSVVPLSSLAGYSELRNDRIAVAIFISSSDTVIELPSALMQFYRLTQREFEVCQSFVNQASTERVAQNLGLKLSSVRSLFKSIYGKTEQSSQAELMRLLIASRLNFRHTR